MKKYNSFEDLIKAFIADNKEIVELLTCSAEDMSYEELCEKEVILYEVKPNGVVEGDLPCSLIVTKDESVVSFDVLCKYAFWGMEGIAQRPLEILSKLYSYLGNNTVVGNLHLEIMGTSGNIISDDVPIYSLDCMLEEVDEEYMESDEYSASQDVNYLTHYKELWDVLGEIITSDKELLALLGDGLEDATMEQLVEQGYIRLAPNFGCNPGTDRTRCLIIDIEGMDELLLSVRAICNADDNNLENGTSRLKAIANCLEKDLLGIAGTDCLNNQESELSEALKMYDVSFKVEMSEATLAGVIDETEIMRKYKASHRPNFFCNVTTMNAFAKMELDNTSQKFVDFTIDVIDAPMMLLFTSDEIQSVMKVFIRNEVYSHDDDGYCIGTATFNHSTGAICVEENSSVDEDGMTMFVKACVRLNQYIHEEEMFGLYEGLDAEKAGVLIEKSETDFTYKIVTGKERPDLLCNSLFGEAHMCRPYTDENSDNWMHELEGMNMSIEEKIESAEAGDVYWMRELTNAYRMGDGVEENLEQAFYWMEKLAEAGDATAQYNVAVLYSHGNGTERNIAKALEWMQKAAENGDIDAVNSLESFEKAAVAEKNAATGDEQAQVDLANYLMSNRSESNLKECYELCVSLSEKGNVEGHYLLGLCYEHGRGCQEDIQKAAEAYKKGADLGDQYCQFNYACLVLNGSVDASKNDAAELVKKSAEQGYDLAQSALSHMYESGQYEEYNLDKAIEWGEKAAKQGNANIQYQVAKLYTYDGKDGKMLNAERAKYWLEKAALQGHEMAYGMLNFGPMWEEDDVETDAITKEEIECTTPAPKEVAEEKEQAKQKSEKVKKAQAAKKGQHRIKSATETICVNDDFNITFSKGMFYIILEESIGEDQKIIKFGRLNEDKQDLGDQVRIDVDADADFFGSLVKREFEPGQYQEFIEKFEIKEVMRQRSLDESNEREKQINAYVTEIRTKEGFKSKYKVYKDEDNLKIGYYTTLLGDDMLIPTYMIHIITPKALYVGGFTFTADVLAPGLREMLGNSEADDEKFLDGIFNSITLPSEIDVDNSGLNKIHLDDKKASKSKSTSSKNERLSEKEVLNQMSDIHAEVQSQLREIDWQWSDEKSELQKLLSNKTYSFDFELQMDADVVGKVIDACGEAYTSLLDAYDDKVERLWEKLETSNARMKYAEECFEMAKAIYAKMDELRYEFKQPGVLGESLGSVSYDRPSSRVRNKWEKRVEDERKKAENSPEHKQKLDSDMEKWKEEVEKIKENREKAMAERSEQIDLHTKGKKEDTIAAKDKERESIMQMQQRNRDNLRMHRLELESMGKIHFVKRSSLEKLIQQEEIKDKEYDKDLQNNRCKLNEELKELDVKAEKEKKAAVEDIEKKYPIPRSPEVIKKIEEKRRKMFSGENGEIKLEILRAMLKYNRPGTSQQIQNLSYKLSNYPSYKISAMISQLTHDGFVGRIVEKNYAYYYINDEVAAKEMVESKGKSK